MNEEDVMALIRQLDAIELEVVNGADFDSSIRRIEEIRSKLKALEADEVRQDRINIDRERRELGNIVRGMDEILSAL